MDGVTQRVETGRMSARIRIFRTGRHAHRMPISYRALAPLFEATIELVDRPALADLYLFAHSLNTMKLVVHVAGEMGVDGSEHVVLCLGALLHDIGKLAVPASLLNATRRLRKNEIDSIRAHSEIGYDSLSDTRIIGWNAVLDVIRHHHERLDGSGYPFGLTAPNISWRTRCVTVCDVFSALIESRPYRPAMGRDEAVAVLAQMAEAGKIDGDIVDVLRRRRPE